MKYTREEQLQAACTQWFWNEYPLLRRMLFHVDNNSYNQIIGAKKKALGVVRGVSDLIFIVEEAVIFIEMKLPGETQHDEQIDFMNKVRERGHFYYIITTLEDFKKLIWKIIGKD